MKNSNSTMVISNYAHIFTQTLHRAIEILLYDMIFLMYIKQLICFRGGSRVWKGGVRFVEKVEEKKGEAE